MARNLKIQQFKANFAGGGARANLFEVIINFPSVAGTGLNGDNNSKSSILCKAANLPASIIAPIEINYRGRKINVAGDRTFEPWTITIINDNDFQIRNAFEKWSNAINNYVQNTAATLSFGEYEADMQVHQLDRTGKKVKSYILQDCWPTNIAAIDVGNDNENAIEEFTVELQVLQVIPGDIGLSPIDGASFGS